MYTSFMILYILVTSSTLSEHIMSKLHIWLGFEGGQCGSELSSQRFEELNGHSPQGLMPPDLRVNFWDMLLSSQPNWQTLLVKYHGASNVGPSKRKFALYHANPAICGKAGTTPPPDPKQICKKDRTEASASEQQPAPRPCQWLARSKSFEEKALPRHQRVCLGGDHKDTRKRYTSIDGSTMFHNAVTFPREGYLVTTCPSNDGPT